MIWFIILVEIAAGLWTLTTGWRLRDRGGHLNLALTWLSLGMSKSITALMRETEVRSSAGYCSFRLLRLLYKSVAWWVKTHVNCLQCCWWNKGYTLWHSSYFTPWKTQSREELLQFCLFKYLTTVGFNHFSHQRNEPVYHSLAGDKNHWRCIFLSLFQGRCLFSYPILNATCCTHVKSIHIKMEIKTSFLMWFITLVNEQKFQIQAKECDGRSCHQLWSIWWATRFTREDIVKN